MLKYTIKPPLMAIPYRNIGHNDGLRRRRFDQRFIDTALLGGIVGALPALDEQIEIKRVEDLLYRNADREEESA